MACGRLSETALLPAAPSRHHCLSDHGPSWKALPLRIKTTAAENAPLLDRNVGAGMWGPVYQPHVASTRPPGTGHSVQKCRMDGWTDGGGGFWSELRGEGTKCPEAEGQEHESRTPTGRDWLGAPSLRGAGRHHPPQLGGGKPGTAAPRMLRSACAPHRWLGPEGRTSWHHGAEAAVQFLLGQTQLEIQHVLKLLT